MMFLQGASSTNTTVHGKPQDNHMTTIEETEEAGSEQRDKIIQDRINAAKKKKTAKKFEVCAFMFSIFLNPSILLFNTDWE